MTKPAFKFACLQVSCDNSPCLAINQDNVHHFLSFVHLDSAVLDLFAQSRVSTEQKLLSGLSFGIKSSAYLRSSERTVVQQACIISCKRNTLCHTLVNDAVAYLSQTIHICFSCTVIATLYGIIKQASDAVSIVRIVFCCVYTALGSY